MRASKGIALAVGFVSFLLAGAALGQGTSTVTEKKNFEILAVEGNKVVVKGAEGTRELTLPADFKVNVDGKDVGVSELKPGMKGTAVVTTKVTSTPMVATEVKNGEVLNVSGNTIIVRTADGIKKFTAQDVRDRNVSIMREGEKVEINQLRAGDRLSATIITKKPPVITTEREVKASASAPKPAPAAPAEAAAAPAPAPAPAPAVEPAKPAEPARVAKKLPKTGTDLPLVGGLGLLCLGAGLGLTLVRRSRKAS
jgi:LPXTG-motif cell wall-anchored protein